VLVKAQLHQALETAIGDVKTWGCLVNAHKTGGGASASRPGFSRETSSRLGCLAWKVGGQAALLSDIGRGGVQTLAHGK